ncbi:MAG: M23 family metallopeptidase [Chloroflexota bacterium]
MRGPLLCLLLAVTLLATPAAQSAYPLPVNPPLAEETAQRGLTVSDEQFVSGTLRGQPSVARFLAERNSFLLAHPLEPVLGKPMPGPIALAFLGEAYSVSPALLLTLAEMEHDLLSDGRAAAQDPALGDWFRWTAMQLSRWFYDYYAGRATPLTSPLRERPLREPAGNAATYALRAYFLTRVYGGGDPQAGLDAWEEALVATYEAHFGPALAGQLRARRPTVADRATLPALKLPWVRGDTWYFTGGPHNFDGSDRYPLSGVDFQPAGRPGCEPDVARLRWVVASAAGRSVDYQTNWLKLDHDGDGNPHSGWQTVYGHLANRLGDGRAVAQGQPLGNPSCRGGFAGGVHVHFGVKFQNVWQPISEFTLSGWQFENGEDAYHGWMVRDGFEPRLSCVQPDREYMDCANAALISDNARDAPGGYR